MPTTSSTHKRATRSTSSTHNRTASTSSTPSSIRGSTPASAIIKAEGETDSINHQHLHNHNHNHDHEADIKVETEAEAEKKALIPITPLRDAPSLFSVGSGGRLNVPEGLRFPLLVLTSLVLSASGYGLAAEVQWSGRGELGGVSRRLENWWEVWGVLGLRVFELAVGWYGNLDGYDITALGLLSRGPSLYLLSAFYDISTHTIAASVFIDFFSTYIPFRLFRPLTPTHSSSSLRKRIPNDEIASDFSVQALSTTLAAAVYSVTLFTAFKTFLPRTLVLGFEGIRSLEVVYRQDWLTLLPLMAGFGLAVKEFVFTPALVVLPTPQDALNASFHPATATLYETIIYNLWGYSTRTKTVLKRTAIIAFISGLHTFVQTWVTLEGVEAWGAAVYSGVWVVAAGLAGSTLGLVGAV